MPRFLVKICGVTTPEDAAMAAAAGADAIGVNLWSGSKRFVEPAAARDVLAAVPNGVLRVGVFVDAPVDEVQRQIDELELDRAQLHGDESPAFFDRLDSRLIRVVRVRDQASFDAEAGWSPALWLYDAFVEGYGGGGKVFDWSQIPHGVPLPVVLSGGLNPANVIDGVTRVRPWAVDVSSGVEAAKGIKDASLIRRFCEAVREADARAADAVL